MVDRYKILTQQLSAEIEATPGTAETLVAADVKLRPFQSNFSYTAENQRFSNDQVADDIGEAADFVSGKAGRIAAGVPLQTSGVLGTKPALGKYLRGCACFEEEVRTITIGAPSGGDSAFARGEAWTAPGGKSGLVVQAISSGGTFRYSLDTGSPDLADTDVVTGGTDGDTATCSGSSAAYAWRYRPRSTGQETLTIRRGIKNSEGTASQDFLYTLKGAMGNIQVEMEALDALRCLMEFTGPVESLGAGSLFTGVSYETAANADLPKFVNATCTIDGTAVRPASITFDLGNQVELDPDPTTTGGTDGYMTAEVSKRAPTITIDPYRQIPGNLDDWGFLSDGTEVAISLIWPIAGAGKIVELSALKCQLRENEAGERAGNETAGMTWNIVRDSVLDHDWEFYFR